MSDLKQTTYLFGSNSVFVEELYERYLENPNLVDEEWRKFFANFNDNKNDTKKLVNGPSWQGRGVTITKVKEEPKVEDKKGAAAVVDKSEVLFLKSVKMIDTLRLRGHEMSNLDPLGIEKVSTAEQLGLALKDFGFTEAEVNAEVDIKNYIQGVTKVTVQSLYYFLLSTYSSTYGLETAHMRSEEEKKWLYAKLEASSFDGISNEDRKNILENITHVEGFEQFLHLKFPGAKRFSVEGGETSVMASFEMIEKASELGVSRVVFGMAHRGRLNMLTKILGKPYKAMLSEFQGNKAYPDDMEIAGDVKYHLGYSSKRKTRCGNEISLTMVPNPSHLETVNPVVMGKVREEQFEAIKEGKAKNSILSILVHGDAAVIGQGVVMESLMMSDVGAYEIAGTLHVIVNNQVGFTANSWNAKSSRYPSEFAKAISVPVFHVNGDDPEAVAKVSRLMVEYRQTFAKDVFMNLVCFRLHGHNETDEPLFTQPLMYKIVQSHKGVVSKYAEQLINGSVIDQSWFDNVKAQFRTFLDGELEAAKTYKPNKGDWLEGKWSVCKPSDRNRTDEPVTGISEDVFKLVGNKLTEYPSSFSLNSKIARQLDQKKKMVESGENVDWSLAEALAFGSLLVEGHHVRITGQDAGRGTFSHRHAVFHDQNTAEKYVPLNHIKDAQAYFEVHDSILSEYAVMGYEYGYALSSPNNLVIWEGQFGDFANGAQIIIDQYLSSAETKWLRMNGLVLLLPHGMEGQGPEHSSARLERFLQLCAEDNMQVLNPTSPASIFHALRRQLKNPFRKPLVIMSPKSLLRNKHVVVNKSELLGDSKFKPVIPEIENLDPAKVEKVVLCSGKVYYDLLEEREKQKNTKVALIRLEQLYPFAHTHIKDAVSKYSKAKFIWCQEEPKNMGAYTFIAPKLMELLNTQIHYIGRKEAASPATGYSKVHAKEQQEIVAKVFE